MASSSAEDTMVGCTMSSSFFCSYTIWALAVTADSGLTDSSRSKYLQQCTANADLGLLEGSRVRIVNE